MATGSPSLGRRVLQRQYNLIALDKDAPLLVGMPGAPALCGLVHLTAASCPAAAVQEWASLLASASWRTQEAVLFVGKGPPEQVEAVAEALVKLGVRSVHRCAAPRALLDLYPWLNFGDARVAWPSEIVPGFLFVGARAFASSTARLRAVGLTHVLSILTEEEHATVTGPAEAALQHHRIVLDDADDADLLGALPPCLDFLDRASGKGRVLVHCNRGRSRSAAVVVAYVMKDKAVSLERAASFVASHRPCLLINPGFWRQLRLLEVAICFERLPEASRLAAQGILERLLCTAAAGDPRSVRLENPKLAAAIAEAPVVLPLLRACGFMTVEDPTRGPVLQPTDRSFERHLCAQMLARLHSDVHGDAGSSPETP